VRAVTIVEGDLRWAEHPDPTPGDNDLLVEVRAAGVNAGDLMQRLGFYPPPPGFPVDIPGMELAGEVVAVGRRAHRYDVGDRVMAVVGGGAQADLALVDEDAALPVPRDLPWAEAGGFPEAFTTAHDALFTRCGLGPGERVLVTGAAGGVGVAAVQLAAAAGARPVASVRRAELRDPVAALGAVAAADPEDALTLGPFDVAMELVGGPGFIGVLGALATEGRVAVIGVGAGARVEVDLLSLMRGRAHVTASTLRPRSRVEKAAVAARVESQVVPLLRAGRVRVPLAATFPMEQASDAYERFAQPGKLGKIVLVT